MARYYLRNECKIVIHPPSWDIENYQCLRKGLCVLFCPWFHPSLSCYYNFPDNTFSNFFTVLSSVHVFLKHVFSLPGFEFYLNGIFLHAFVCQYLVCHNLCIAVGVNLFWDFLFNILITEATGESMPAFYSWDWTYWMSYDVYLWLYFRKVKLEKTNVESGIYFTKRFTIAAT